jgi:hypothetical protein
MDDHKAFDEAGRCGREEFPDISAIHTQSPIRWQFLIDEFRSDTRGLAAAAADTAFLEIWPVMQVEY